MDEPRYISRIVNLTIQDYLTIRRLAEEEGLGQKGFSNALRLHHPGLARLHQPDPSY